LRLIHAPHAAPYTIGLGLRPARRGRAASPECSFETNVLAGVDQHIARAVLPRDPHHSGIAMIELGINTGHALARGVLALLLLLIL